jgi:sterol desaturase/sphingolipid hydroxylase (fatty acid hydroxylase superfamily)
VGIASPLQNLTRTIVSVPDLIEEMLVVVAVVAFFVLLHAFVQRRQRSEVLRRHNDVAGYLFSAVGVLYAVVLGFVVVVVWQKYDGAVANVESEVDAVGNLYHVVDSYPAALRNRIRTGLRTYADIVAEIEWPAMARGESVPAAGSTKLEEVAYLVNTFGPANFKEFAAQQAAMATEQRLFDARRSRLVQAVPAVPSVLWFALVVGALAMVAFCFIFGVENRPAQLTMTAILVGLIGILFIVILEFSTPFSGSVRISNDGWVYLQQRLPDIQ